MAYKVFIDGMAGTTGLKLAGRLKGRQDIELVEIGEAQRKDQGARLSCMDAADITFLCLPDESAAEIAKAANVLKLALIHYSPRYTEYNLKQVLKEAQEIFPAAVLSRDRAIFPIKYID